MLQAYSQLSRVLRHRDLTVPELHRRIRKQGLAINLKSLYRLAKEDLPLARLDLRVAGAICQECRIPLSELVAFEGPPTTFRNLAPERQRKLDKLMSKNSAGKLTTREEEELRALVQAAEDLSRGCTRRTQVQGCPRTWIRRKRLDGYARGGTDTRTPSEEPCSIRIGGPHGAR